MSVKKYNWTNKMKKWAHEGLLSEVNAREVNARGQKRKSLRGIRYSSDGSAKWGGHYDYTIWLPEVEAIKG